MPATQEAPLFVPILTTKSHRDEKGRQIVDKAEEVSFDFARKFWADRVEEMSRKADLEKCQVVVLANHPGDINTKLAQSLREKSLGAYPAAVNLDKIFDDKEKEYRIIGESPRADIVHVVSTIEEEADLLRIARVADHFKDTLNAKYATLTLTHMVSRQDKNIDSKTGQYKETPVNVRADMKILAGFYDLLTGVEPHSGSAQFYAAQAGLPMAPLSPWKIMIDEIQSRGVKINNHRVPLTTDNSVTVRPDKGRNTAATRISDYTGTPSVSFNKTRLECYSVSIMELSPAEQQMVKGKICLLYDDEANTLGTLERITQQLDEYGALAVAVCFAHLKLTRDWEEKMQHPKITTVLGTDTRKPVNDIRLASKLEVITLAPWLRQIMAANINGANFWENPEFRHTILQPLPEES